jgi:hypothetical protein
MQHWALPATPVSEVLLNLQAPPQQHFCWQRLRAVKTAAVKLLPKLAGL